MSQNTLSIGAVSLGSTTLIPVKAHNWAEILGVNVVGENGDIDTAAAEDVWTVGGTYTFLSTAQTLYASSSNAGDTTQVITIIGLDASWVAQEETVTLNGQNQAEIGSGVTWIRVNEVINNGTVVTAGDVYIAETDTLTAGVPDTASKIKGKMGIVPQRSEMAIWSVAAGFTGYVVSKYIATAAATKADVHALIMFRDFGGIFRARNNTVVLAAGSSVDRNSLVIAEAAPAKSDIKITVQSVSVNDAHVDGGFSIFLLPDAN